MTDLLNTTVRATHRMSLIATALIAVAFGVAASLNMAAAGQSVATAPADGVIRTLDFAHFSVGLSVNPEERV
jgi:hypothetical protein